MLLCVCRDQLQLFLEKLCGNMRMEVYAAEEFVQGNKDYSIPCS